jgi:hypothetical protein
MTRAVVDSRRHYLAGYLSGLPEFSDRHPETMLPLADRILALLHDIDDGTIA